MATAPYLTASFLWCSKNEMPCSTSRANLSVFNSLRVILDTKTSGCNGSSILARAAAPGEMGCRRPRHHGAGGGAVRLSAAHAQAWYGLLRVTSSFILRPSCARMHKAEPYATLLPSQAGVIWLALALFCGACAPQPHRQKLTIAAAADLNFAMPEIARQFRAAHPAVELEIAYGSSGNYFAQISNGAPFDVEHSTAEKK